MKIQYGSDLHMEFHENMRFMRSLPLEPFGDLLVIAGDVGVSCGFDHSASQLLEVDIRKLSSSTDDSRES